MNGFAVATRYLTIVPVPGGTRDPVDLGRAAPWFPVVGLALGLVVALTEQVTALLFPTLLSALLTITVWKLLTGGLHLDGLADCLDGLVGHDVEHRLAIMRDSRIGAFGAIGLILIMLLEIAAVAELPPALRWRVLIAAPAVARAVPVVLARLFPPARPSGQGAAFHATLRSAAIPIGLTLAVAVSLATLGIPGLTALAAAILTALGLGRYFTGRLGGITGDVLGASVEITELVVLLTVSAWAHLAA